MKITLDKVPKGCTIIEGFPGFGYIGTIVTEYLIEHLKAKHIGEFVFDEMPPTVAIHDGKLIKPMSVYFDSKHNLIILHTMLNPKGFEWQVADAIVDLVKKTKAKSVLSIEGVGSPAVEKSEDVYWHGDHSFGKSGAKPLKESIIVGVTSAMLLRYPETNCLFASTSSQLPDSKAAARIISLLDKHLDLNVDPAPLIKQAELFEKKLKTILKSSQDTTTEADKKNMGYLG